VHGSNASLHTWEPWVRLLADEFRLISLDLPAHGLTGEVPDGRYDMEAFMATIDALRAHLALKQFVFIGNSMGGGIAWRYTLAHPQRVIALVLIDATGPPAWHLEQSVMAEAGQGQTPLAYQLLQQARSFAKGSIIGQVS
jgi:pimeloyl-ACP methyl ester carboxylesterase